MSIDGPYGPFSLGPNPNYEPAPVVWDWNAVAAEIHAINVSKGFWPEDVGDRNVGEALMLVVSEVHEAIEAYEFDNNDDKLPQYPGLWVEIADAAIRLADMCGAFGAGLMDDLNGAFVPAIGQYTSVEEDLFFLVRVLAITLEAHRKSNMEWLYWLAGAFDMTIQIMDKYDIPYEVITDKMAYNSKRPFKHGKAY